MKIVAAICNYNRKERIVDCVRSFLRQSYRDLQAFVVDNASSDGSAETLTAMGDGRIHIHRNDVNEGGAGGFFKAIEMAMYCDPDYLALLDSDCVMGDGALRKLVDFLEENPAYCMAGPKVYWAKPPGIVQELGGLIDWKRAIFNRNHGDFDEAIDGELLLVEEVDYLAACCLVVRGAAVKKYGNMRPDWFIYFDDIEWATRMKRGGDRIIALPTAVATHYGGGANRTNHFAAYYLWRNRIHFFKEYGPPGFKEAIEQSLHSDLVRALATCIVFGAKHAADAITLAVNDAILGRKGRGDFSGMDLSLDKVESFVLPEMENWPRARVEHVLDDAIRFEGNDPRLILEDGYRKRLPLSKALELLPLYTELKDRFAEELRVLMHRRAAD